MYHDMDMDGWWMFWGGLMMLLFWGGLAALVIWVVGSLTRHEGTNRAGGNEARVIAERRYASGEISRDEYLMIVRDLGGEPRSHSP